MNASGVTTIATFSFPHEAHIAKANLEAEGIPAFIADEHTINMQWFLSNALGGVRIQVPSQFVEKASAILQQDFSDLREDEFGKDEDEVCPNCGSIEIEPYTKGKRPAILVLFLLGFPLFFYRRGIRCRACGKFSKT
jgi:hypothetical protein